ncbi:MAG: hypothetical protein OXG82_19575 [Gammaproteobacteria bacterium]|nr:hypothetical protein [Gammaproteobacteria bacterium]
MHKSSRAIALGVVAGGITTMVEEYTAQHLVGVAAIAGGLAAYFASLFLEQWQNRRKAPEPQHATSVEDPEWETVSYHGETGYAPSDALRSSVYGKRFPHTVRNKRTGETKVIPHPSAGAG